MPPILKAAGLYTSPNLYSRVPEGAFTTADNTVIRQPDVLEPRKGQWREGPDFAGVADSFVFFGGGQGRVVNSLDSGTYKLYSAALDPTNLASNYTQYSGTYSPVDSSLLRMRFVEAQQNLYFSSIVPGTGSPGSTKVLINLTDTLPVRAGTPQGLDWLAATTASVGGTSDWLPDTYSVAYRAVFFRRDSHGNQKLGAPSGRVLVTNSAGGARPVQLTVTVPYEIYSDQSNFYYQIYRSLVVPPGVSPDDELFLVMEGPATDIGAGSAVNVTDVTPEMVLGQPLYTNPKTGNGILDANYRPPVAKDLTLWQDRVWYANTRQPQRLTYRLLGVGTPDGIQAGDRVVIGERILIANAGTDFTIVTSGDPGFNVERTAQRIVKAFDEVAYLGYNGGDDETPYLAFYTGEGFGNLGEMLFEELTPTTTAFYAAASRPSSFWPDPPQAHTVAAMSRTGTTVSVRTATNHGFTTGDVVILARQLHMGGGTDYTNFPTGSKTVTVVDADEFTYTDTISTGVVVAADPDDFSFYKPRETAKSSNDEFMNNLMYSKFQEPEAVPLLNYVPVGAKNKPILRIAPLRDRLYVFKEDEGIFVVSGEAPFFRVDLLDNTVDLMSPDTVVPLNNQLFALTNQGVVQVSESGVGVVSGPIEEDILSPFTQGFIPADLRILKRFCWAAPDEPARNLYVGLAFYGGDINAEHLIYVYNVKTKAWTRWRTDRNFAAVNPVTDDLWLAHSSHPNLYVEQDTSSQRDYSDYVGTSITATNSGNTLTVSVGIANVAVGDFLGPKLAADVFVPTFGTALVTAVNGSSVTYIGTNPMSIENTAYVYKAYAVDVEYSPLVSGDPGIAKQWPELQFHFWDWHNYTMTTSARTDQSQSAASTTHVTSDYSAATLAYNREPRNFRQIVPLEKQRGTMMRFGFHITEAQSHWRLLGHTPTVLPTSQRTKR